MVVAAATAAAEEEEEKEDEVKAVAPRPTQMGCTAPVNDAAFL